MSAAKQQFDVRLIDVESRRVETGSFDMEPQHEQASQVIGLMREFLSGKPTQFKSAVTFLKRGEWELEWEAASGGVAFAAFLESGRPAAVGVLLARLDAEADAGMLGGFEQAVLQPVLGELLPVEKEQLLGLAGTNPLLIAAVLPGRPELAPTLHLLNTALGAVYFKAMRRPA